MTIHAHELAQALVLLCLEAALAASSASAGPPSLVQTVSDLDRFCTPPSAYADDLGQFRSLLTFEDGRPVLTPGDWRARRQEILHTWHEILGPWPPLLEHPHVQVHASERLEAYVRHRVEVEVAPGGRTLPGYLLVPHGAGPFPAVLVVYYDAETGAGLGGPGKEQRDFGHQLAQRGFVTLSIGAAPTANYPDPAGPVLQPLSYLAYMAANCHTALTQHPAVDGQRIGIVGHSYGGKWAMFAACLHDKFACAAWSDGGIVFDERRPNVNYWEPWYLGFEAGREQRAQGMITDANPRTGAYRTLIETGHDLHEVHALMAPRPFLVSGGSEDPPERWRALNHTIAVNRLLGYAGRVAMTTREGHAPTAESNAHIHQFFERYLISPQ